MDIKGIIEQSIAVKRELLREQYLALINKIGQTIVSALQQEKKVLIAGNGGSAADAQHFAAELSGRFMIERGGLPAFALNTNSSVLTAIANDFAYEQIFARQIDACGRAGDIFVGITTSGNSKNIILALQVAKSKGLITIGLLGNNGGGSKVFCDLPFIIPSNSTPCIQEAHILVIHLICYLIDEAWKESKSSAVNYG